MCPLQRGAISAKITPWDREKVSTMGGVHLRECPLYRGLNPAKNAPWDHRVSTMGGSTVYKIVDAI